MVIATDIRSHVMDRFRRPRDSAAVDNLRRATDSSSTFNGQSISRDSVRAEIFPLIAARLTRAIRQLLWSIPYMRLRPFVAASIIALVVIASHRAEASAILFTDRAVFELAAAPNLSPLRVGMLI